MKKTLGKLEYDFCPLASWNKLLIKFNLLKAKNFIEQEGDLISAIKVYKQNIHLWTACYVCLKNQNLGSKNEDKLKKKLISYNKLLAISIISLYGCYSQRGNTKKLHGVSKMLKYCFENVSFGKNSEMKFTINKVILKYNQTYGDKHEEA